MKKLSIVIPIKYGIDVTRVCIDSIRLYTKDYELIIVSDGADKETKEFLQNIECDYLIENEKALGFPGAVNKGIEKSSGDYVIILNNDTVVLPEWADKMVAHFERDKKLGLLSCTTSQVEGFQHIDYNKRGVDIEYADVVTGILMMLPRKVLDELKEQSIKNKQDGYWLDERFGLGGQCDSSLCVETKKLGYQVGIARDVYIYHYGSYSFRELFNNDAPKSHEYAQSRVKILRDKYNKNMNMKTTQSIKAQENNVGLDKPLIFIAVCTMGTIRTEILSTLIKWTHDPKYRVIIHPTINVQPLDAARNTCVKEFMKVSNNSEDRLLFLDDDILPPIDALDRLYNHNKDAISATCFVMKNEDNGDYFPYPPLLRLNEDNKFIVYYGQGLERIDGCGGGFIMFKRKVFEKMDRPYEYKYYPDGTLELVADFNICLKMKKLGFELWADYSLLCDHIKPVSILGFQNLLAKVKKEN